MQMSKFQNAEWIWCEEASGADSYAEFYTECEFANEGPVTLRISADSNYAVYINGMFADSGQYADFPHYKVYDEIDITRYVTVGKNHIAIVVWYYGVSSFTYYLGKPGLIFEIEEVGECLCASGEHILSRPSRRYCSGERTVITRQQGLTFHVDMKADDDWMLGKDEKEFQSSMVQTKMPENLILRETKKLIVQPRVISEMTAQGGFAYFPSDKTMGARMQHAALSFYRLKEMGEVVDSKTVLRKPSGDGLYFIVDLKEETAGFLDFDIEVEEACEMEIGWGEHLEDGRCRTQIDERDFSAKISLKSGRNAYMNPFRRLGCRYLQFFVHSEKVTVHYVGIRPTIYPVTIQPYDTGDILRNEIYRVSCNTLIHCMHEHYEDCPWREQAFYALDSRNQMLCGYHAFREFEFPKAGLKLIAQSVRKDGLLPMCYPTQEPMVIVSFPLSYVLSLAEYYEYTKDQETLASCFDAAKIVMDTFVKRVDETGLVSNFTESKDYWNFYEWRQYLDGECEGDSKYEMCLNAWLSYALEKFVAVCDVLGVDAAGYVSTRQHLNESIVENFYDKEEGLFTIYRNQNSKIYSVLANALGILCGVADGLDKTSMIKAILLNGWDSENMQVIGASLSMHAFRYDALIREDKELYKEQILADLDKIYFRMLREGATTFWETEDGSRDFLYAGSLCHGWSAMPVYYYAILDVLK